MDIKLRHPQILGGTGSLLDSDLFDGYNSYDFVKKSETYSFQNNIGNSDLVVSQREARKLTLDNSSFQVSQSGNNPYVKLFLSGRVTNTNPSDYLLGDPTGSWYLGSEWSNGSRNATAFIKSSGVQTGSSTTDLPILRIESSGDIELYSGRNLNISNLGTYWLDSRNENATPNLYLNGATYNSNGWGFDIDNTSKDLKIFYNSLVDGSDNLILPANGSRPLWYNNQLAFRKEFEWSVKAMHIDSLYAGKNGYVPAGSTVPTKITTEEFIDHIRNIYDFGPNVEPYYILVSSNQYANPIITNTGVGDINLANADILVVNGNKDWNYTITVTTSDNNQLTPDPTPVKNTIITVNAEDRTLTWVDYSHGSQLYMTVPQLSIVDQVVTTSNISVESWLPGVYDVTLARENYWLETVTIGKTVSGVMYRIESTESKTTMNEFRLVNNVLYWYMPQAENWEFRCNGVLTQNNQSGRYGLLTNDFFDVGEIYEVAAYNPSPTEHPTVIKANILVSLDTDGKRVFSITEDPATRPLDVEILQRNIRVKIDSTGELTSTLIWDQFGDGDNSFVDRDGHAFTSAEYVFSEDRVEIDSPEPLQTVLNFKVRAKDAITRWSERVNFRTDLIKNSDGTTKIFYDLDENGVAVKPYYRQYIIITSVNTSPEYSPLPIIEPEAAPVPDPEPVDSENKEDYNTYIYTSTGENQGVWRRVLTTQDDVYAAGNNVELQLYTGAQDSTQVARLTSANVDDPEEPWWFRGNVLNAPVGITFRVDPINKLMHWQYVDFTTPKKFTIEIDGVIHEVIDSLPNLQQLYDLSFLATNATYNIRLGDGDANENALIPWSGTAIVEVLGSGTFEVMYQPVAGSERIVKVDKSADSDTVGGYTAEELLAQSGIKDVPFDGSFVRTQITTIVDEEPIIERKWDLLSDIIDDSNLAKGDLTIPATTARTLYYDTGSSFAVRPLAPEGGSMFVNYSGGAGLQGFGSEGITLYAEPIEENDKQFYAHISTSGMSLRHGGTLDTEGYLYRDSTGLLTIGNPLGQVQSDWSQTDTEASDFIKNKPESLKNPNLLYFGEKSYDGSSVETIAKSDLGIDLIEAVIPAQATVENQLADKNFVNSTVASMTGWRLYMNTTQNSFPTAASLRDATVFYRADGLAYEPTTNDYTVVLADEERSQEGPYYNQTTRWKYFQTIGWGYDFPLGRSFTANQLAAIDSGITTSLVGEIGTAVQTASIGDSEVTKIGTHLQFPPYPTGLQPSGAAGGDLTGTYPNPTLKNRNVLVHSNGRDLSYGEQFLAVSGVTTDSKAMVTDVTVTGFRLPSAQVVPTSLPMSAVNTAGETLQEIYNAVAKLNAKNDGYLYVTSKEQSDLKDMYSIAKSYESEHAINANYASDSGTLNGYTENQLPISSATQAALDTKLGKTENAVGTTVVNITNMNLLDWFNVLEDSRTNDCVGGGVMEAPDTGNYLFKIAKHDNRNGAITAVKYYGSDTNTMYTRTVQAGTWSSWVMVGEQAETLLVPELPEGTDILSYALGLGGNSSRKVWVSEAAGAPISGLVCYEITKHDNIIFGNIIATDFYNNMWTNGLVNGVWQGWQKLAIEKDLSTPWTTLADRILVVSYRKTPIGMVEIHVIYDAAIDGFPTVSVTLPVGFRPNFPGGTTAISLASEYYTEFSAILTNNGVLSVLYNSGGDPAFGTISYWPA